MKRIKKIGKTVAGSALLVGATLAGAASMGAAQSSGSSGMTLGDYPQPFVNEDGEIDSTIVVGEDAATVDVVAGMNIAGSLGNAAFDEEQASVEGGASFGFSATDGVTLNTRNDQLYFGDTLDEVRQTLTKEQLPVLADDDGNDPEVLSGDEEQQVEQFVYLGNQQIEYGELDEEDGLHVNVPSSPDAVKNGNNLMMAQANFEDGVEFYDGDEDDGRNEDVFGEQIELFGTSFTVAEESFDGSNELVLYGSTQTTPLTAGEATTIEIGDEEIEVEFTGINSNDEAVLVINGQTFQLEEDEAEDINGQDLRVTNINNFPAEGDTSDSIELATGSSQIVLEDGSEVMMGSDEDEVDGTRVSLEGNLGDKDVTSGSDTTELSSISIGFGAEDNDEDFLESDSAYENPVFSGLSLRFGGLNPDASEDSDSVGEVEFTAQNDDAAVSFDAEGSSVTVPFSHYDDDNNDEVLASEDAEEEIVVKEGAEVQDDEYFTVDAGDFSHLYQVNGISVDEADLNSNGESSDEATVDLNGVIDGSSVEVDLDADGDGNGAQNDDEYEGTEVIDGQTYYFVLDTQGTDDTDDDSLYVTYGDDSDLKDTGSVTTLYAAQDVTSGAAVSMVDNVEIDGDVEDDESDDGTVSVEGGSDDVDISVSGTATTVDLTVGYSSASDEDVTVDLGEDQSAEDVTLDSFTGGDTLDSVDVTSADGEVSDVEISSPDGSSSSNVFGDDGDGDLAVEYELPSTDSTDAQTIVITSADLSDGESLSGTSTYSVVSDNDGLTSGITLSVNGETADRPSGLVLQPEDDNDEEGAFLVEPGYDSGSDDEMDVGGGNANFESSTSMNTGNGLLETEDSDVNAGYNVFGTYVQEDTDNPGSVTLNIPFGQATAGVAVTGPEGSISAGGAAETTTAVPTGYPNSAALDSEIGANDRDQNMILVGGPAVNSLVSELASENMTMTTDEYLQRGEGFSMVQLIEGAFQEDYSALVVAGTAGADTREAGNYIANYEDNSNELAGQTQVVVGEGSNSGSSSNSDNSGTSGNSTAQ